MPMYQEAIAHFLSGIALSFGDRYLSKNASRHSKERVEKKLKQTEALGYLVQVEHDENKDLVKKTNEYYDNIRTARDYFRGKGKRIKAEDSGLMEKLRYYKDNERINNIPFYKKLGAAFGLEVLTDGMVAIAQIAGGNVNALGALGESLYQGPAMFFGFLTGRAALYVKDLFRSSDEKELDSMAKELTRDKKLLAIVREYSPTKYLETPKEDSEEGAGIGERVKGVAASVGSKISEGVGSIKDSIDDRRKAAEDAEKKRAEEQKSKYDDY